MLDEPTANMDTAAAERTLALLRLLKHEGHALLVASHDPAQFAPLADHHHRLAGGRLVLLDQAQPVGQDTGSVI